MARISQKRTRELERDRDLVLRIYREACQRFGEGEVKKSFNLLWTYRCMAGCLGTIPFSLTVSQNWGEMSYVAREICGLGGDQRGQK